MGGKEVGGSWKSCSNPNTFQPWEELIVVYKDNPKHFPRIEGQVSDITGDEFKEWVMGQWNIQPERPQRVGHPAPFPEELAERVIKLFSYPGDLVCDIFAGSGTTGKMAKMHKRKYLMMELDKQYHEVMVKRLSKGVNLEHFWDIKRTKTQREKDMEYISYRVSRLFDRANSGRIRRIAKFLEEEA